jgi:Uncharacterized protein conserved in cyanobacteria
MYMPAAKGFYTAEMVRSLNASERRHWPRYETVHGELLVSPAPRWWHQEVVGGIYTALRAYLSPERLGRVVISPADVTFGEADTLVQPDIFVVPMEQSRMFDWRRIRHLLLAVEVLSPSSMRADREVKRRFYQRQGVPLYWVVDADARSVETWTPEAREPRTERETLTWYPVGASEQFTLPLADLFQP